MSTADSSSISISGGGGGYNDGSGYARPESSRGSAATATTHGMNNSTPPTGVPPPPPPPVVDLAVALGPVGQTYDEEFNKLKNHVLRNGDLVGPAAPVMFVNTARDLYKLAGKVVSDAALVPHTKCTFLFQIFDTVVLVYKNLSFVYCDREGARSVYGYSDLALKTLLSRVEAIARQVAVCVHDAYSLTVLNDVVATTQQRLSQVQTEQDMLEFFRGVSGVSDSGSTADASTSSTASDTAMPRGVERYEDPFPEAATLLRRLYATNADTEYVRDFHDTMFLIATSNAPSNLSSALETRLADKDRNIVLLDVPGDRMFATSLCASAIAFLRQQLRVRTAGDQETSAPTRGTGTTATATAAATATATADHHDDIETYRINYGRIFSKYRGESERNFDNLMEWIKKKVRASDKFRIFWFPDIENLMSPRTCGDQEHIAAIKNSMLQHMDTFNKDRTLRSFLLLFNSSEGVLDSAFSRRLETVVKTPPDPLTDLPIAVEVVGAELAHYRINLSDNLAARVAVQAGTYGGEGSRVGGFAYVQAALREMYVDQKLILRYDARAIDTGNVPPETSETIMGRYAAVGTHDRLYDLGENPLPLQNVKTIAFRPSSGLATLFADSATSAFKYNANIRGDPKDIDERTAARIIFLHDV